MDTTHTAAYAVDGAPVTAEEAARRALIELYLFVPDDVLAMLAGQEPERAS